MRNPFSGLLRRSEPKIAPVIPLHRRTSRPTSHRASRRAGHTLPAWQQIPQQAARRHIPTIAPSGDYPGGAA